MAEWHFFATAHGKGPCDGIGGNLKRLARKASLQGSVILNAEALYTWAKNNMKETTILFSSKTNYEKLSKFLETRFALAKTIPGTLKYHAIIPASEDQLILKIFSFDEERDFFFQRNIEKINKSKEYKMQRLHNYFLFYSHLLKIYYLRSIRQLTNKN